MADMRTYWPEFLAELREFQELLNAEQPEFQTAASEVRESSNNFFWSTLSEEGLSRWEYFLRLDSSGTPEQRRIRLLAYAAAQQKMSLPGLAAKLKSLCSEDTDVCEVELDTDSLSLSIRLEVDPNSYDEVYNLVHYNVPVNLAVNFAVVARGNLTKYIALTGGVFMEIYGKMAEDQQW